MPDISTIWVEGTEYDIKDAVARADIESLNTTKADKTEVEAVEQDVTNLMAAVGTPLKAATAAAMTDHNKIYVYTGSETGYNFGHWYYWDGSAWADGGVYNSKVIETDKTLSVENMAADAEAAGGKIAELKSAFINSVDKTIRVDYQPSFSVVDGGIRISDGANVTSTTRCRTQFIPVLPNETYLVYLNNPDYKIITAWMYASQSPTAGTRCVYCNNSFMVTFIGESSDVYMRLSFSKADDTQIINDNDKTAILSAIKITTLTDKTLSIPNVPPDAKTTGEEINKLKKITVSNNLLPLDDYDITYNGVHINVTNGIMTLTGKATAYIRVKVTNGYDAKGTIQNSWKTETLNQFEVGKTYTLHNYIVKGTKTTGVGVSLRGQNGDSVVSLSTEETPLSTSVAFAMLYIPINAEVDFSYVPIFIEGGKSDNAYFNRLNPNIQVTGVKNYYEFPTMSDEFVYNSDLESAIKFPETYADTGERTPLIVLCHGLSSAISPTHWGTADTPELVDKFIASGFAVLDVNQVTTQDWINPALIQKYMTAVRDAKNKYYIKPVAIYAESMGGLIGLCLSTMLNISVCCVSGLRLDFLARYNNMIAEQKAIVDTNLGFTNGYDASKIAGYDKTVFPAIDASNNNVCNTQFPPTLFVVGTEDTYNEVSLVKVDEIKRGGTIVDVKTYTGNHNGVCYLKVGTSYDDVMTWFKQWII